MLSEVKVWLSCLVTENNLHLGSDLLYAEGPPDSAQVPPDLDLSAF